MVVLEEFFAATRLRACSLEDLKHPKVLTIWPTVLATMANSHMGSSPWRGFKDQVGPSEKRGFKGWVQEPRITPESPFGSKTEPLVLWNHGESAT